MQERLAMSSVIKDQGKDFGLLQDDGNKNEKVIQKRFT
jgi:hypothetical protein